MPVIAVANRKGGSGKSTLSTNIAAWCAQSGWQVMLGDIDRQQSVRSWLQRRPDASPPITTWAVDNGKVFRAPRGTTHVVLDTPGALYDYEQSKLLVWLDAILVPIGPSLFDREASLTFLSELRRHPRVNSGKCKIAMIGMRWPQEALERWKRGEGSWEQSLLTVIPEDQRYRAFLDNGSSVFDDYSVKTPQDMVHWTPLLQWLGNVWTEVRVPADQTAPGARPTAHAALSVPHSSEAPVTSGALGANPANATATEVREPSPLQTVATSSDFIPAYLRRVQSDAEATAPLTQPVASDTATTRTVSVVQPTAIDATEPDRTPVAVQAAATSLQEAASNSAAAAGINALAEPANEPIVLSERLTETATSAVPLEKGAAQLPDTVLEANDVTPYRKDKGWLARWLKLA